MKFKLLASLVERFKGRIVIDADIATKVLLFDFLSKRFSAKRDGQLTIRVLLKSLRVHECFFREGKIVISLKVEEKEINDEFK